MKSKNLIVSVPRLEPLSPPISVAIIAHAIEMAGHPVEAIDFNIKFFRYCANREQYYKFDEIWDGNRDLTLSEFKFIIKFLRQYDSTFAEFDRLLVSVFGFTAKTFTHILLKYVKKHHNMEIVLGGQGVLTNQVGAALNFGDQMIESGLAHYYISGEGETAIVEFLNKNYDYAGINSPNYKQIDELNDLPFPNYKYFNLTEYDHEDPNDPVVFVVGSRGCVRKCTYCDVARFWPKYRYRSGRNIADELIFHYETTGVSNFYFTDSLVNGSLKSFRDMCTHLAEYNEKHNAGFKWKGQYIFRPKGQSSESDFELLKRSGCHQLYVGVETGSDKIRWEMDKKFTNEDVDFQLDGLSRHGVKVMFLMLTGYITETLEDHHESLKMYKRWQRYVADGTINAIDLGPTLLMLKDTPVERMAQQESVYFYSTTKLNDYTEQTTMWESAANPDLTVPERIRRRLETHEEAIKYNWPVWRGEQRLAQVRSVAEDYKKFLELKKDRNTTTVIKNDLQFIKLVDVS